MPFLRRIRLPFFTTSDPTRIKNSKPKNNHQMKPSKSRQSNMETYQTFHTFLGQMSKNTSKQITDRSDPGGDGTLCKAATHAGYVAPRLTELPSELIYKIFEHLICPADVLCLGLSSPELYPFVQKLLKPTERDLYAISFYGQPLYRQLRDWMGPNYVFSGYLDHGKMFVPREKLAGLYAAYTYCCGPDDKKPRPPPNQLRRVKNVNTNSHWADEERQKWEAEFLLHTCSVGLIDGSIAN